MNHRPLRRRVCPNHTPKQVSCYTCGQPVLRVKTRERPVGVIWVFRNLDSGTDHRCTPEPFTEALRRVCRPARMAHHGQGSETQVGQPER